MGGCDRVHALRRGAQDTELLRLLQLKNGWSREHVGLLAAQRVPLTAQRLVQLATIDGAVDLGIADRTGSLTPGKRADIILVRAGDINIAPAGDAYDALVGFGQPRNVDTVIVDGRILWSAGRFTALDHTAVLKEAVETVAGLRTRANWT